MKYTVFLANTTSFRFNTRNPLFNAVRHCGFRCFCTKTINYLLQTIHFFCLHHGFFLSTSFIFSARTLVLTICTAIFVHHSRVVFIWSIQVDNTRNRFVEQFKVVTNYKKSAFVVAQEIQQPCFGIDIQVVCWFVEQQHVATSKKNARQLDSATFSARQNTKSQVESFGFHTKASRNGACFTIG